MMMSSQVAVNQEAPAAAEMPEQIPDQQIQLDCDLKVPASLRQPAVTPEQIFEIPIPIPILHLDKNY